MRAILSLLLAVIVATTLLAADIHDACNAGNLDRVKQILKEDSTQLQAGDVNGHSPLHRACYSGHLELAQWLLDQGADANATSTSGSTPLHGAAFHGHTDVVRLLIHANADVNIANAFGWIPVLSAAGGLQWENVDILLENGSPMLTVNTDGNTIGHYAAYAGNMEMFNRWIEAGGELDQRNEHGRTPLCMAVHSGAVENVLKMLNRGATTEIEDNSFGSPLMAAIEVEKAGILGVLLARGTDPNLGGRGRNYPLLNFAVQHSNQEIIDLLLGFGADPDRLNNQGIPLISAMIAEGRHTDLIPPIIAASRNVDMADSSHGRTPLHTAAIVGNELATDQLILQGASPLIQDTGGKRPIDYALQYGHWNVAERLNDSIAPEDRITFAASIPEELAKPIHPGEAHLWYTGHCGWAIKTSDHLLLFDYWKDCEQPENPSLRNGWINLDEFRGQNVIVFVSHSHIDHYDQGIFPLADSLEQVTYVYGWEPEANPPAPITREPGGPYSGPEYTYIPPRNSQLVDGMKITTITSVDGGEAFMLEGDGLVIYHAGDHAGWAEGHENEYTDEIDFLAERYPSVDLAFLNVTGCRFHDLCPLEDSNAYFMSHIRPSTWVPTHGLNSEFRYVEAAQTMAERGFDIPAYCPENCGDDFHYVRLSRASLR